MESLGEKLKNTRMEKDLTLDQISRETSISLRFLEALENENFDVFPGEPYIIGFIRNYGNYLELDVQKLIALYRALRIQEQPVPVEQLLKHSTKLPKQLIPIIIIILVLAAAGWGIFKFISNRQKNPVENKTTERTPSEYMMEGNTIERRFYKNDTIFVKQGTDLLKLELINLGEAVTIRTPGGSIVLDLSQSANVNLNNDGTAVLRITVVDFEKNNTDMGAFLHFFLNDTSAINDAALNAENDSSETNTGSSSSFIAIFPPPNSGALISAFPFTLQLQFQGYCMFRWEILNESDRRDRNQRYFQRNDELNIQAQNGIRLWVSNAQAVKIQAIGGGRTANVEIGSIGEVVVADIRWIRDEENRYRLMFVKLEN